MNDEEELLVRCIAIRAAYGGMAGDVTMLRQFAAVWSTRSATAATIQDNIKKACATSAHMHAEIHFICNARYSHDLHKKPCRAAAGRKFGEPSHGCMV